MRVVVLPGVVLTSGLRRLRLLGYRYDVSITCLIRVIIRSDVVVFDLVFAFGANLLIVPGTYTYVYIYMYIYI